MNQRVGIALGANIGDCEHNIATARELLLQLSSAPDFCLSAPLYKSAPVECADDAPDFFNTVIEIEFSGEPYELLEKTQGIEVELGRPSDHGHHEPRTVDIDILYFGDVAMEEEKLTIPHPRMLERLFVLQPLNDIRPELELPSYGATIAEYFGYLETNEPPLVLVKSVW